MSCQSAPDVTKNAAALFVGRTLAMALSLVFVLFAARILGLTEFGRYALARTYFDLLLTLAVTGLGIFITREIARNPSMGPLYFGTAAPLGVGLAVVMGTALVLVSPLLGYGPDGTDDALAGVSRPRSGRIRDAERGGLRGHWERSIRDGWKLL